MPLSADHAPRPVLPVLHSLRAMGVRARRLDPRTLAVLIASTILMILVVRAGQAMQSELAEDILGLLPPALFLVSVRLDRAARRAGALAFFAAACALLSVGLYLIIDAAGTLLAGEASVIGAVRLLGMEIWQGWLMLAALILAGFWQIHVGRVKRSLARPCGGGAAVEAGINAADWRTSLTGLAGIAGIGLGYWWADAAAAGLISVSLLKDGCVMIRVAHADLMAGAPARAEGNP